MIYANHTTITPDQEKALLDFVNSGKGFLPIHCASFCFQNSPAYIALVGAQFLKHGTGEFTATIVQPNHPVLDGVQPFQVWDETYVHTKINPDKTVLMERVDDSGREPWTWVREQGKGRVFYTAYGHDERVWGHPMFQRLVRNGILWAVGPDRPQRVGQRAQVGHPSDRRSRLGRLAVDRVTKRATATIRPPISSEPVMNLKLALRRLFKTPFVSLVADRVAGARHRRERRDLLAVQPDAAAAAAGRPARRAGEPLGAGTEARLDIVRIRRATATRCSAIRCSATSRGCRRCSPASPRTSASAPTSPITDRR